MQTKWIKYRGLCGRRTATYVVPEAVLKSDRLRFGLLPRWAARMLPTWGERCVLSLVLARDSLCEFVDTENGGCHETDPDLQGEAATHRRIYSVTEMARDSGLHPETISVAKHKLVERGLLRIDGWVPWNDYSGRFKPLADSVFPVLDFQVPASLLDEPRQKPANYKNAPHTDSQQVP